MYVLTPDDDIIVCFVWEEDVQCMLCSEYPFGV